MKSVLLLLQRLALRLWDMPGGRPLALRCMTLHSWLIMVRRCGRVPNRPDALFNDFLHALKTGPEIDTPLRRHLTDKAKAKDYIAGRLGPGRTIPTLAVLRSAAEIAAYVPPVYPVAVKPTHSCGRLLRVDTAEGWAAAGPEMMAWLAHDYFRVQMERNYAGLDKAVIVEPWLDEALRYEGSVHCRGGVPKVVSVIERYSKARQSYAPDRRALGVSLNHPLTALDLTDWRFFDPLLRDAARLAKGLSYIRVDFYTDGERVIFGEMTNLPAAGLGRFYPENGEAIFSAAFFGP